MWFDSKHDFTPSTILLGLLLCPWMWGIFFWWDPTFYRDGCSAVSCNFGLLTREDEHTSFYSTILFHPGLKLSIQKTKIMVSSPITSWQIDGKTIETVRGFIFCGSKITADGDCSLEIKRHLLLGSKAMTNLTAYEKAETLLCQERSI